MSDVIPISKRDRRPLPAIVREGLEDLIRQGRFPAGSRLPPEEELAELLSVSRPTLREALGSMEADGVVVRRRGVGTFVASGWLLRNNLSDNFGVTDLIERHGAKAGSRSLEIREEAADEEEAEALGVPVGTPLVSIERVRTADGVAVVFSHDLLPKEVLPDGERFEGESVYRFLRARGRRLHHGVARLFPLTADQRLARLLDIPPGAPLLLMDQIDYDHEGRPVVHAREWHVANAFEITVYRKGPDQ
jgi:GntR family transcriptional regulator